MNHHTSLEPKKLELVFLTAALLAAGLLGIIGVISWFYWTEDTLKSMPENFSGIYLDFDFCMEEKCFNVKEILPPKLLFVPRKTELSLCSDTEEGWCADILGTATATLKYESVLRGLKVRTF